MEKIEDLNSFLDRASSPQAFERLLHRGEARSLMLKNGALPTDAPAFGATIETDLAEYGFALLRGAMSLRNQDHVSGLAKKGFECAAKAFHALVRNGNPESSDRGFRRTIAAAAYHLAGFSAVAYSFFNEATGDLNISRCEEAIRYLILRDFGKLHESIHGWLNEKNCNDDEIAGTLMNDNADVDDALSVILNTSILRALAYFDFALQTGESGLFKTARTRLETVVSLASNAENVPLWWISNLCRHLIDDLWRHSLHENLPGESPEGAEKKIS